jgi:signal peptidase I
MAEPLLPIETPATTEPPSKKRVSFWARPITVFLLSLLIPGLGQVVNREPWKGLGFAVSVPLLLLLVAWAGAYRMLWGLVASVGSGIALQIWIAVEAFRVARRSKASGLYPSRPRAVLLLCGGLTLTVAILASTERFAHAALAFRAYKGSSDSFCPTMCEGERFIVDIHAFRTNSPKRGDVIAFDFQSSHQPLYVKRIVGVEGDVVSEKNGAVFVNGNPFTPNETTRHCGQPPKPAVTYTDEPRFKPVTVPPGSYFVMGDNTTNSYDSRIEGFGFVTRDQIAGKLMYIYWSPGRSRIGCWIE